MGFVQEGGWVMYPLFCTGLFGFVLGVAALVVAVMKKRTAGMALGAATLGIALLGCCTMGGGYFQARRQIDAAVAFADPQMAPALRARGLSEAMNIIVFGACTGALPLLLGGVALARAATLPKGEQGRPPGA